MKELANNWIRDVDSRIKNIPQADLDERIDLMYSLGYVYDPYESFFFNPFINRRLKPIVALVLDLRGIEKLHSKWLSEFSAKNNGIRKADEISSEIFANNLSSWIRTFLAEKSGVIGVVLLLLVAILSVTEYFNWSLITTTIAFILLGYYVSHNMMFEKRQGQMELSALWKRYQTLLIVSSVLTYPYLYYLLYSALTNYWLPVIIILALRFFIETYSAKNLSKEYWETLGIISIDKYSKKNGLGEII